MVEIKMNRNQRKFVNSTVDSSNSECDDAILPLKTIPYWV